MHGSFMACLKARYAASPALMVVALLADICRKRCVRKGVGHFERKFQGEWGRPWPTNGCWREKTRVPGLSRGFVCVIIRLAVLTQYRRATDRGRRTDRRTH